MSTRTQLVEALLQLPASERAAAAKTLLESLDRRDETAEVERAWRDEIAGRVHDIESGAVELEDGPTAMRLLQERAKARLARHGA
jgi:hypothetical protein